MSVAAAPRVAIVAARFNAELVDRLIETALAELGRQGVDPASVAVHRVPGAYELPLAAQAVLRADDAPDAVLALGAVVKGETPHFDFVAKAATDGILRVGLESGRPVIFGVLTVNTMEQAWDRTDGTYRRGEDWARDALEMAALVRRLAPARA